MGYFILFADLDGTLLDGKSQIHPATRGAIGDAFDAGKQFALCSGRSWRSLERFERELGIAGAGRYGVAFNGGIVYEIESKRILLEQPMGNEIGFEVVKALKEFGADILLYAGDTLYADVESDENKNYSRHVNIPIRFTDDFFSVEGEIMKILVKGENEKLKRVSSAMTELFAGRCSVFFSASTLIEFARPETHKGSGIEFLANYLKIPMSGTIAIGDQANDIEMIKAAGLGIAVSNAADELKRAADVVLPVSNDEDAVGFAIKNYLLA